MTRLVLAILAAATAAPGAQSKPAQDEPSQMRARFEARLEQRLRSNAPLRIAADDITLTSATLVLSGHVRIRFENVIVSADQATLDRTTPRVTLGGSVNWQTFER